MGEVRVTAEDGTSFLVERQKGRKWKRGAVSSLSLSLSLSLPWRDRRKILFPSCNGEGREKGLREGCL